MNRQIPSLLFSNAERGILCFFLTLMPLAPINKILTDINCRHYSKNAQGMQIYNSCINSIIYTFEYNSEYFVPVLNFTFILFFIFFNFFLVLFFDIISLRFQFFHFKRIIEIIISTSSSLKCLFVFL